MKAMPTRSGYEGRHRRGSNRRQRRAAGAVIGAAAVTTMAMAGTNSAAEAAIVQPFPGTVASCDAGDPDENKTGLLLYTLTADCTEASPAVLGQLADLILAQLAPDLRITPSAFNGATVVGPTLGTSSATIRGTGYTTALVILGGDATAEAQNYLSGAFAIAGAGGDADAKAYFGGLAVAVATGNGSASATALPGGIAIADVLSPDLLDLGDPIAANALALGGISGAFWNPIDGARVACTALFATASVTQDGANLESCTSVLFIFQKSQSGSDPAVYSIKNPFSIALISPVSDITGDFLADLLEALPVDVLPEELVRLASGQFVPKFDQDLIRISFGPNGPVFGSDLFPQNSTETQANRVLPLIADIADLDAADAADTEAQAPEASPGSVTFDVPPAGAADLTPVGSAPVVPETSAPAGDTSAPDADEDAADDSGSEGSGGESTGSASGTESSTPSTTTPDADEAATSAETAPAAADSDGDDADGDDADGDDADGDDADGDDSDGDGE